MINFKNFLIPMSFLLVQQATALDWPRLDSEKGVVHRKIINSILTKDTGGQFHGQWFKSRGQGIPDGKNQDLENHLQGLTSALQAGRHVELRPTSEPEIFSRFTRICKYQILVDGDKKSEFTLYNAAALQDGLQNHRAPHLNVPRPIVDEPEAIFPGIRTIHVGHGARPIHAEANAVSDDVISQLIAQHGNKPMLNEAFKIIEGADVAQANDRKVLAKHIRKHQHINVPQNTLFGLMDHDLAFLKKVQVISKSSNSSTPFRDQLKEMITFNGMAHAKALLQQYPSLLKGEIPNALKGATGGKLLVLKTALFYVTMAKSLHAREDFGLVVKQLSSFYPGKVPGNSQIKGFLNQTNLVYDGLFFSPANAYVKNADTTMNIEGSFEDLPLQVENGRSPHHLEMVFADCSGFIANIVRKLHPENNWIQKNRFMSWHIAAAYDHLMNKKKGTNGKFFDINGNSRSLKPHEAGILNKERPTKRLKELSKLFTPVENPAQNIKPGDVIVTRHPTGQVEGHVMMVVDQNPQNPDEVIIVELTRADVGGTRHGYNWRRISLSNPGHGKVSRVLRIK